MEREREFHEITLKDTYDDDKGPFSGSTSFRELGIFIICICNPSKRELLLRFTTSTLYLFPLLHFFFLFFLVLSFR
jgi:hypothetical protein